MSMLTEPRASVPANSPMRAAIRHPFTVVFATLSVLAACLAYGWFVRAPTYTAESRVSITKVDIETQALPGYAQAAQSLASAYARAVPSTPVQRCIARGSGRTAAAARKVSASPIPESPVIRVEARGATSTDAIALANAGGRCLVSFVKQTAGGRDAGAAALADYRSAAVVLDRRQRALRDAQRAADLTAEPAERRALARAKAALAEQRLVVSTLSTRYQQESLNDGRTDFVQLLVRASTAASDRTNTLALLGFSGLLVGALLGLSVAGVLEARRH